MTTTPGSELVTTRKALHRLAEHLLAAARKRATGQITLLPVRNGIGIPPLPDGMSLAVVGTDLVVTTPDGERRAPVTTLAAAAAFAGVSAGFPWTKNPPATPFAPDELLALDAAMVQSIAQWFAIGQEALTTLAVDLATQRPSGPQIYPEHFDLGMTAGAVNYGFSPGDDSIPHPYAYVGPHEGPPDDAAFWNAPFGAYRTWRDISSAAEALTFLREGRDALAL